MKTIKISKKQAEQFEQDEMKNHAAHWEQCGNFDCLGEVIEYEWETTKDRKVFHVCKECGAVETVNI